jgi:hypothetical protein
MPPPDTRVFPSGEKTSEPIQLVCPLELVGLLPSCYVPKPDHRLLRYRTQRLPVRRKSENRGLLGAGGDLSKLLASGDIPLTQYRT